jgi:serine/threonine kinase PknH
MTVFICHASRDDAQVAALVRHLQAAHETVWLDQSLLGGEAWWSKILHQIRSCTVFLVAMSNHSLQSKPCRAEINYAKALGLPILPVLIGEVDSYRIDPIFTVQSVDYRNPDVTSGATLIAAVRERAAERTELPDPLPEPPPLPYEYLQRLGVAIDSPDELSPTEQTTILLELRRALRDEDDETVRADITRLLRALRRRSEATHTTVADIDELLSKEPTASADSVAPAHAPEALSAAASGKPPTPTQSSTAPSTPRWRQPKTIAIAAAALVVVAVVAVVGYLLVGQTSPSSDANKPAAALAPPYSPPAAPASAAAANQMSGHYTVNETAPAGYSITTDWYFTSCGDGCASVATTPGGQAWGQARLVNGQWTLPPITSDIGCPDGSKFPNGSTGTSTWDPNTLTGKDQLTYTLPACGQPVGHQQTNSLQLRQAP